VGIYIAERCNYMPFYIEIPIKEIKTPFYGLDKVYVFKAECESPFSSVLKIDPRDPFYKRAVYINEGAVFEVEGPSRIIQLNEWYELAQKCRGLSKEQLECFFTEMQQLGFNFDTTQLIKKVHGYESSAYSLSEDASLKWGRDSKGKVWFKIVGKLYKKLPDSVPQLVELINNFGYTYVKEEMYI
jgi:hypothetical protein